MADQKKSDLEGAGAVPVSKPAAVPAKATDDLDLDLDLEFDATPSDGVDDEAEVEPGSRVTFKISSYGADYTVDGLVTRMNSSSFFIPPFQRSFVWSQRQSSRFIESLLLGLPVPGIFVAKEESSGRHLVVYGQQRLRTLQSFYSGRFPNSDRVFRLRDIDDRWNGKVRDELSVEDRRRLDDSIIHTTVFKQDDPTDNRSIYFVFERLNTGGSKLYPQEIRNCVSYGQFTQFLNDLNLENKSWREIFGPVSPRQKDQELLLRFFALLDRGDRYSRPMKDFLNDYVADNRNPDVAFLQRLNTTFSANIELVNKALGQQAFRPERNINAAVFDAVMVGLAQAIAGNVELPPDRVRERYSALLLDKDFKAAYSRATADENSVKNRLSVARRYFQG
jgi:hypothetical protein